MIYILKPELTSSDAASGAKFLEALSEATDVVNSTWVGNSELIAASDDLADTDAIVFVNPTEGVQFVGGVLELVRRAKELKTLIFPVALKTSDRLPPVPVDRSQSFDIEEFQAQRHHVSDYVLPAAQALSRQILARVLNTCFVPKQTFFIAHARADGENAARLIGQELVSRGHVAFRDLVAVDAGEDAQSVIDHALYSHDCMLFIDTPQVGESEHVANELRSALATRLPVVWLKIESSESRSTLKVVPSGAPNVYQEEGFDRQIAEGLVDEILKVAHQLSVDVVASAMTMRRTLQNLQHRNLVSVTCEDKPNQIYRVELPRDTLGLPERPLSHICQFFGRRPMEADMERLGAWVQSRGLGEEPRRVDATVVMDPRPGLDEATDWHVHMSGEKYLRQVGMTERLGVARQPHLLLSGSFDAPSMTHHETKRAVGDIAREWMKLGGRIVFGGHPTFTPMIIGAARQIHPLDPHPYATMYVSEFFVTQDDIEGHAAHLSVITSPNEGDRERSLTRMRTEMMDHEGLRCVLVLGGRTDNKGVREEIALARARGLPVLPLAAPGGEAAVVVNELTDSSNWTSLTAGSVMSADDAKALSYRTDYRGIARDLFAVFKQEASSEDDSA